MELKRNCNGDVTVYRQRTYRHRLRNGDNGHDGPYETIKNPKSKKLRCQCFTLLQNLHNKNAKTRVNCGKKNFKPFVSFFGSYEYLLMQFRGTLLGNSFRASNLNSALHYVHSESKILKRKVLKPEQER